MWSPISDDEITSIALTTMRNSDSNTSGLYIPIRLPYSNWKLIRRRCCIVCPSKIDISNRYLGPLNYRSRIIVDWGEMHGRGVFNVNFINKHGDYISRVLILLLLLLLLAPFEVCVFVCFVVVAYGSPARSLAGSPVDPLQN